MSVVTTAKLLTAEEFCDFTHRPENGDRWFELVNGEVIEMPPPTKPHGAVSSNVTRLLGNYTFEQGRFYVVGNDAAVILKRNPDTVRGPDVAVYNDALSFDELHPKYGESVPRLAVEVLSPNDRLGKVMRKVKDYLAAGVPLIWVIDPETRNVSVHRPKEEPSLLEEKDEITGEGVLPGFRCLVCDFFRLPGQNPTAPTAE